MTSKITLTKDPMAPACCAVCNKSSNGSTRFADFQRDLDYYGVVLICEDCSRELVVLLDFVPREQLETFVAANEKLVNENIELREENARVRAALDAIFRVRPDLDDSSSKSVNLDRSDDERDAGGGKSKK